MRADPTAAVQDRVDGADLGGPGLGPVETADHDGRHDLDGGHDLDGAEPPDVPSTASDDPLTVSHARSLAGLPLDRLTPATWDRDAVELDAADAGLLLGALRGSSDAAATRLARATRTHLGGDPELWAPQRPADVAAALHRILTRSRFLKGSRSCFPVQTAREQVMPFVERGEPVTVLVSGFPFKQHDNGLKAGGPWPDLAELGALLRLRELDRAFGRLYPPGLRLVVLNDGGYARARPAGELRGYRRVLQRFARLAGVDGVVRFHDQSEYVADLLGERLWNVRERRRSQLRGLIRLLAGPPGSTERATGLDDRVRRAFPDLAAGVPGFSDLVSSLIYSVPVPPQSGTDQRDWARRVLARPDELGGAGPLPQARREVLHNAWRDALDHVASSLADNAVDLAAHYPPHVRLATVASRQGCAGFSYLGGSALLPWHGTGALDGRGRLCADFLVSLRHRGFVPVHCTDLLDTGPDRSQPLFMVPGPLTVVRGGRRRIRPDLLALARLRAR